MPAVRFSVGQPDDIMSERVPETEGDLCPAIVMNVLDEPCGFLPSGATPKWEYAPSFACFTDSVNVFEGVWRVASPMTIFAAGNAGIEIMLAHGV